MRKLLKDLFTIALAPMEACPPGLELEWLKVVLEAMGNTYRLQDRPQRDIEEEHLQRLFDVLADQWRRMREIAVQRCVPLPEGYDHAISVQEFRAVFVDADALNRMFPEKAA